MPEGRNVCSLNCFNKGTFVFLSKVPTSKLSDRQIRAIQLNRCLLLMYGKKSTECKSLCEDLQKEFPDSEFPALALGALLFREKKIKQCEEVLGAAAARHSKNVNLVATFAHVLLLQGKTAAAIKGFALISKI